MTDRDVTPARPLPEIALRAVMTTWHEADIVATTVRNALEQGCEAVHLLDNGSEDDTAQELGVDPSECLYVGDGGSKELTGATAVGMRAVLLVTPFGDDYRYDAEQAWDGAAIDSLQELPGFVQALR